MGREQLDIFTAEGVNLRHVIVGHSCGSADLRYHVDMLDRGCMLGFDRFGVDLLHPDSLRMATLIGLLGIGFEKQFHQHPSLQSEFYCPRKSAGDSSILVKGTTWMLFARE
jgi:predicted metal-dependent phosphotriesterase family hydrolase